MLGRAILVSFLLVFAGCGVSDVDPSLEIGGSNELDIPAGEIVDYPVLPLDHCVGIKRDESFAQYNGECQAAIGLGDCVKMPNPKNGDAFFCALCGLKGSTMVCYMINTQ